jgi:three-Cys-motif partner protein
VPKQTVWKLPDHSAAKHLLLKRYLEAWYPKLAFTAGRFGGGQLNYIDAFAGPGIYEGGEPGSPIVALSTLLNHGSFSKWGTVQFLMYFVEEKKGRVESLEAQVEALWQSLPAGKPPNVHVTIRHSSFFDLVTELNGISKTNGGLAPTFAFVDPFGFKGLPLAQLCDLLSGGRCEVLFNFMYDAANRWAGWQDERNQENFALLFNGSKHLEVDGMSVAEREKFLHNLIRENITEHGKFSYVKQFEMEGTSARTLYSLFFATHHKDGLRVMKDAMWAVDPTDGQRFSDRLADKPTLFSGRPDFRDLQRSLTDTFAGQEVPIERLEEFTLFETRYKDTHLRSSGLMPLEAEGRIELVNPKPRRRKTDFPAGSRVRFAEKEK